MEWAAKRKIIYAFATVTIVLVFAVYELRGVLFPTPTCFDKKKNGYESGLDCGGTCALRCTEEVAAISVDWSNAIKTSQNTYDFVAMLSNKNINSAPTLLSYVFVALNKKGEVIKTEVGSTIALVDGGFPIVAQNIVVNEQPASLLVRITPSPYYATIEKPRAPLIRVSDFRYEPGSISRIYVTVTNTTRNVYLKLPIRLVAYDENDNVVAAGESVLPQLDKEEEQEIVFTWHHLLPVIPTKFRAYPIISPYWANQ